MAILVTLDLETTGLRSNQDEIIEIAALKVDYDQEIDRFHSLVRPERTVSDDIFQLTSIPKEALEAAPSLSTVLPKLLKFLDGATVVGHNVQFDLSFIEAACEQNGYELPCSADGLDTLLLAQVLEPEEQDFRLGDVALRNNVELKQAHRAMSDAETTQQVLSSLERKALTLPYGTLQQLARLAGLFSRTTAEWFLLQSERRYQQNGDSLPATVQSVRGLVFSKDTPWEDEEMDSESRKTYVRELTQAAVDYVQQESALKQALPSFEVRPGQQKMVEAVAQALSGDQHLLAEAGTGTGKSLAYLIPAALYAAREDARVMISTHTIALQEQIRTRDFPTLRQVLPFPLKLSVFKGRTHYVCMRKLHSDVDSLNWSTQREEIVTYMKLLTWLTGTPAGDREELGLSGNSRDVWPRIQSETETCINKRCPFFKHCYYFRARTKAYEADLVVTNHSLIFSDLKAEHHVLPFYDKLIVDEAHHLEEQATKHLGAETHYRQMMSLFGRLIRDNERQGVLAELAQRLQGAGSVESQALMAWLNEIIHRTGSLRSQVEQTFLTLSSLVPSEKNEFRISQDIESNPSWKNFLNDIDLLTEMWTDLSELLEKVAESAEDEPDEDLAGRLLDGIGFYPEIGSNIQTLSEAADFKDDWVTWVEIQRIGHKRWTSLHRAPIEVAPLLEERVFNSKSSVILTSATLSVNHSFQFTKEQLGLVNVELDGRLASIAVESPFDLRRQALLCVPKDVPDLAPLSDAESATWLSDSLYHLTKASDGRVLALFTSHAMLRATANVLREPLQEAGYDVLAQGVDGNRSQLLKTFRRQPKSILLGAQSFWEGIDLPGDQLRTLVIIRLPFAPPTHPVTVARHQLLEARGKSSFRDASLPQAVVRFRQGFGRLIRSTTDKGAVVVYDKRIVTARYGKSFIKSLASVSPVVDTEESIMARIRRFFSEGP
ncbi:ATP-dependent DNA helicase DinG [Alicyclobacillus sp. SO9]|uniref:ATP-dependent DNA helicase DinG n=1 Tax=Alicyclobacillus sp. SO9 TaxID=2665646 RepID=UPI0018E8BA35|nr:ATP-dependent DNA helicase DinG [Alicyclobacillus sp. SO9]QQE76779.1 ATP-dependent DNA helicase DinG [Alicyclobacillus sp. SO9]